MRKLSLPMRRLLRCVPDPGESTTAHEVAGRLDMTSDAAAQLLARAVRKGLVVRLRPGDYSLAPKAVTR